MLESLISFKLLIFFLAIVITKESIMKLLISFKLKWDYVLMLRIVVDNFVLIRHYLILLRLCFFWFQLFPNYRYW